MLAAGIRYRLSAGVGQAMAVWTSLIVAVVVVADLGAALPPITLPVSAALVIATLPLLRRILRSPHEQHIVLLPVSRREHFAIDCASVALFLLPPHLLMLALSRSFLAVASLALGSVVVTALLGDARVGERRSSTSRFAFTPAYEVRWLVRMRFAGLATANVLALLTVGAAELAIRNNDVVRLHSVARIACAFASLGAALLASELTAARTLARPWRSADASLPLASRARLRSLLAAALVTAAPFLAALTLARPVALPFVALAFAALVLIGETQSLRSRPHARFVFGVAGALCVLAALDTRAGFVAAVAALLWSWRQALFADRTCDVPLLAESAT